MCSPVDISKTQFRSSYIKVYEFGFVILCAAAVNLGTQTPLSLYYGLEWAECLCYFLASMLVFLVYQRLTVKWTDALITNSGTAIEVYHLDKFSLDELLDLNAKRRYAVLLFFLGIMIKGMRS